MKFADIPFHEDIKDRLREIADSGRIPHALLLEGPSGTAKYALARAFAQYVHCTNRHDGDSCGICPQCRQHQSHRHIDTLYSFPVAKKDGRKTVSDDYRKEFIEYIEDNPFMDFEQWPIRLDNANVRPRIYVEEAAELLRRLSYTAHASKYKIVLIHIITILLSGVKLFFVNGQKISLYFL